MEDEPLRIGMRNNLSLSVCESRRHRRAECSSANSNKGGTGSVSGSAAQSRAHQNVAAGMVRFLMPA